VRESFIEFPRFLQDRCREFSCQFPDLFTDQIPFPYFPVDLTAVGGHACEFHVPGSHALMNGGFLVQPLPCVRAVVNLLFLFQVQVAVLRPGCPPLFSVLPVIPVVGRNGDFLPEVFRSLAFPDPRFLLPVTVKLRDAIL
jgi:hypothetical protein